MKKTVFLDKDGTLVENIPYNADPGLMRLVPGASRGLGALHDEGYELVVITNQPGIAMGRMTLADMDAVEARMRELLAECGLPLGGFYFCPHHPGGRVPEFSVACDCRKPGAGMIFKAAEERSLDLTRSWMIGDILDDIEAGRKANLKTVLIDNGNETEWRHAPERHPDHIVADIVAASEAVLSADITRRRMLQLTP
jgi:D-glycero-D-manno-heptose 1,7-bisphosphate phosphatase